VAEATTRKPPRADERNHVGFAVPTRLFSIANMDRTGSRHRYIVVALLILLFAITYLDRVCISVAGPRMQEDLHIGPAAWGWVSAIFTLAYCLFEIPSGALGDRAGGRKVLTRIVLWWSAFTALTGMVAGYPALLLVCFLFGAGEAGAFPNAGVVVSRWFPRSQRSTVFGTFLLASQAGGALAPLLVVPIQIRYGWRASFFAFGVLGVLWASVWYAWFRDSPSEKWKSQKADLNETAIEVPTKPASHEKFPLRVALRSPSIRALLITAFCYVYVYNFFQTWFHTFLVRGRGFTEAGLFLSFLPYVIAGLANLCGGLVSDRLVRRIGLKNGRRIPGIAALVAAAAFAVAAVLTHRQIAGLILLTLMYGAITFQQSAVFGVCLDIGRQHSGAVVGLMNTSAQFGGLVGALAFGCIVERFHSYDAPFVPMVGLLLIGAVSWIRVDASEELAVGLRG
jgi:ACS family glucarate transporter-like MFS transporter